jgi:heme A synthase
MPLDMKSGRFVTYVWLVLAFNMLVILWGAVVRATGSGAGCGAHWPLCNGEVIPQSPAVATFIEFFHRLTSGVALALIVVMFISARRIFPKGHPARGGALASLVLIVVESLIGMLIVVLELTAQNTSAARAAIIAVHQVNTLFLLGAITLTGWWASGGPALGLRVRGHTSGRNGTTALLVGGMAGLLAISATGAITALGDTLFPATSLQAGFERDLSPAAHFLEQLRIVHPIVAGLTGIYIVAVAWMIHRRTHDPLVKWLAATLSGLFLAQCALGAMNVVLLAPVWMQLAHLLMADAVWICFVLLAASTLGAQPAGQAISDAQPKPQPV